jgi:putative endonuclease
VAELVDALDSKSCSFGSAGSIPASGTQVDASSLRVSLNLSYRKIVEVFLFIYLASPPLFHYLNNKKDKMTNQELGILGEKLAQDFLKKKGFQHLDFNYRFGKLEVDIISVENNQLVVTEVKTRQTAEIGEPWRAVTRAKQRQIIKVADAYVKWKKLNVDTRFDIVSIVHNQYRTEIEHIIDAFTTV